MPRHNAKNLDKDLFIRDRIHGRQQSSFKKYQALVTGRSGLMSLFKYELITSVLGPLPGPLGLFLRKMFYRRLFRSCGGGLVVGRNVVVRHADKIAVGRNVVIDDNCLIDGRGAGESGIKIGNEVIISRGSIVQSKSGPIRIGDRTNIGSGSLVCAMGAVEIGQCVLIAGGCSISGGQYHTERTDLPISEQGVFTRGPVVIGDGSWLGMKVLVLDAVSIGRGCVVGSGAVVTGDLPDYTVAVGVPARVLKVRSVTDAKAMGLLAETR